MSLIFDNLKSLENEGEPDYQPPASWRPDREEKIWQRSSLPITFGLVGLLTVAGLGIFLLMPSSPDTQIATQSATQNAAQSLPTPAPVTVVEAPTPVQTAPEELPLTLAAVELETVPEEDAGIDSTSAPDAALQAAVQENDVAAVSSAEPVEALIEQSENTVTNDTGAPALIPVPIVASQIVASPVPAADVPVGDTQALVSETAEFVMPTPQRQIVEVPSRPRVTETQPVVTPAPAAVPQRQIVETPPPVQLDLRQARIAAETEELQTGLSRPIITNSLSAEQREELELYRVAAVSSRQSVEVLRSRLLLALESGQRAEAAEALASLNSQLGPDSGFARRMNAYYLLKTEQYAEAGKAYDELLAASPEDNEARLNSGWLALQQGDLTKAGNRLRPLLNDPAYRAQATPLIAETDRLSQLRLE